MVVLDSVEKVLKNAHCPLTIEIMFSRVIGKNRSNCFKELKRLRFDRKVLKSEIKQTMHPDECVIKPIVTYQWVGEVKGKGDKHED